MKATMKVSGAKAVGFDLRSIADRVPDGARKQMHRSAEKIVKVARIQTPRDLGNLEKSIQILKSYGYRGRLQIDIGIHPSGDEVNINGKPINVSDYAAIIHENYESVIAKNGPGKRTLIKMNQYPGYRIGSGFLSRAAAAEEKKLEAKMIAVIDQIISEVNL